MSRTFVGPARRWTAVNNEQDASELNAILERTGSTGRFFCWVERDGVSEPILAAYIDQEDWKEPDEL